MTEGSEPGPLISVIVPAYNAEPTLREALGSALAGTYANIEVIVVDDGSTDATAAIAEELEQSDDRVRLCRREQGGVSAALNLGLRHARGQYVARLDSDDIWHPTKLDKQIAAIRADPEAALVYTFVRYIDGEGRVFRDVAPQRFGRRAFCRCLYEGLIGGNSSVMIRRSAVDEAGGYNETLPSWEDLLLYLTVSAKHPITFVPEYLVGYRVRPGSLSADPQNILDSWRAVRAKINKRFPETPRTVRRWAHGTRMVQLAESFAWRGRYGTCAKLLAEALRYDPAYLAVFLRFRLWRKLTRRQRPPPGRSPSFTNCRPDEQYRLSSFDRGVEGRRFHAFEASRKRYLDRIDRELAH